MSAFVLVNGEPSASVPALDRGFAFGDGVFRTLLVRRGRALNWDRHFLRLAHDCQALALPIPREDVLLSEVARVGPDDATVKVIVSRGVSGRGYATPADIATTRVVAGFPPPDYPSELARDGVTVRRCALTLSEQPRLAGVKTLNRLENVLARAEWLDPAIREGLLCDAAGRLVEGTMSNVFLVREGAIITPALTRCGIAGAQRERLRDLARAAGIAFTVRDVEYRELADADEAFLANSLIGIWPIARNEARTWTPGALTRRLQELLTDDDARPA